MTVTTETLKTSIVYPDTDGEPMAESDIARDYLIYAVEALSIYFQAQENVYVSGNMFVYYRQGSPSAVVAPDVFVVFGIPKRKRMSYKVWQENNQAPDFVLEITSLSTQDNDEKEKPRKYSEMGVREYFQYDPTGDYLSEPLKGAKLVSGIYQPLPKRILDDGTIAVYSEVLDLDLRLTEGELRFYEPKTNRKLLSHQETELARQQSELEKQRVEQEKEQLKNSLFLAIARLNSMGLNAEAIAKTLNLSITEVNKILNQQ